MKKRLITIILTLVCTIACAFGLSACGGGDGGGSMKLNEEQWDAAFTAARAWEDYSLDFRLSLSKNYVLAKDEIRDSGVTVEDVMMQFTLDSTNEQGLRASANRGISNYNEDGSVINDSGDQSYYSVENGKLFSYYYDDDYGYARKYESDGTGTVEEQFAKYVETFDYYLPMFVFTKGDKTYKIDELNQVLKHTGFQYKGNLGFELNLGAIGGGDTNDTFKTESAVVTFAVFNSVYNPEMDGYEWTEKLPEDWSKWNGEIRVNLHFETEVKGEKYLATIEMSYKSNVNVPVILPDRLCGTRYEAGNQQVYKYDNVYGQAGPAQSDSVVIIG